LRLAVFDWSGEGTGGQIVVNPSLIHPPTGIDHFDSFNTWLQGINAEMVAGAGR
jgi:hypothetical protein